MSLLSTSLKPVVVFLATGISGSVLALEYERDVMPIFEVKCFQCHSVREGKTKGGLRLDDLVHFRGRFAEGELVTPGNPKLSALYYALTRPRDEDGAMPPANKGKQLTAEEVERVRAWIADGARVGRERAPRDKTAGREADNKTTPAPSPMPVIQDWTNREGKTIRAALLKVESGMAVLRLPNGTVYRYPIIQLSEASQALLPSSSSAPPGAK